MPKNINPAYRVHVILSKAAIQRGEITSIEAWASTFAIVGQNSITRNVAVARMLGLLHEQIEEAHAKMKTTSFSTDLYDPAFTSIKRAIAIENLSSAWQNYKVALDAATLKALAFCSEVLPNEEQLISQKDLDGLTKELQELKTKLSASNLPEEVKSFISEQITIIEIAIREYPVSGSKVFTEALIKATATAAENADVAKESASTDEFQALRKIWNLIKEVNANVDTVQKLLIAGTALATIAGNIAGTH